MDGGASRCLAAARVVFVVYTLALVTATHWPGLAVRGPVERTDLLVHIGAFGGWALLLGATRWLRARGRPAREGLRVCLVAVGFGVVDEVTQPLMSRVFDVLDLGANFTGAALGGAAVTVVLLARARARGGVQGGARGGPDGG